MILFKKDLKDKIVTLGNKEFHVKQELGRGGEGTSYLALFNNEQRVLKVIGDSNSLEERLGPRLLQANAALNTRFKCYRADPLSVVVESDYVEGENLREHLNQRNRVYNEEETTEFLIEMMRRWISPLFSRNLVHRDIKPENIIMSDNHPYLIDFGSLKNTVGTQTLTISVSGTPGFSRCYSDVGIQDDMYSLARIASFLLTAKDPKFVADEEYDKIESKKIIDALTISDRMKGVFLRMQGVEEEYKTPEDLILDLEGRTIQPLSRRGSTLVEPIIRPPEQLLDKTIKLREYFNKHYNGLRPEAKPLSTEFLNELEFLLNAFGFTKNKWSGRIINENYIVDIYSRRLNDQPIYEDLFLPRVKTYFGFLNINNRNITEFDKYLVKRMEPNPSYLSNLLGGITIKSVHTSDSRILSHVLSHRPGFTYQPWDD
ncbi:MAG: hypothetical protein Q8Q35_04295 [Nanoarchaeota archaeon]|nr:hypothetical protein [Nanoarchaeota archaeon]